MAVIDLREGGFDSAVSGGVSLVDFRADWCSYCRMLDPTIEKLAEKYAGRVKVCKVDADAEQALARRFQVEVLPTVLLFKDGAALDRLTGSKLEGTYSKRLDALLS